MLLGEALSRLLPPPPAATSSSSSSAAAAPTSSSPSAFVPSAAPPIPVLEALLDLPQGGTALFSLHNLISHGRDFQVRPGMWYGPYTVSLLLKNAISAPANQPALKRLLPGGYSLPSESSADVVTANAGAGVGSSAGSIKDKGDVAATSGGDVSQPPASVPVRPGLRCHIASEPGGGAPVLCRPAALADAYARTPRASPEPPPHAGEEEGEEEGRGAGGMGDRAAPEADAAAAAGEWTPLLILAPVHLVSDKKYLYSCLLK
jgi:hypothetical protein